MTNGLESKKSVIIGAQLKRARDLLQLTPEDIAEEINVKPQDIINWEKEQSRPTLKQLEDLAALYGREIDYFLRETPHPPEKIEFRGKSGQTLRNLSKETKIVLARFDELCRTVFEFENLLNKRREVKLPHFDKADTPKAIAQSIRRIFDAGNKPLPDLRNLLENKGILIFELPVPDDAFSGFSFWHSVYGPCILLNAKELKGRRNFTLAHELCHLLYSHGSSLCYVHLQFGQPSGGLEYKANQMAIELFLPEGGIREDFEKRNLSRNPSEKQLAQMASKWGVSIQALGYRLEHLNLIKSGLTDRIMESKPKYFRRPKTPSWERQLGKRFVDTTIEAYKKGHISYGKVADALKIPIRKAMELVEQRES
ncbi:MAG: XRE family transcriptional regulator [candidate division Zixibacteria bacterium]|nr:XRE family transcriptional regulator [candidate division Zixibacteria bacterium]